MDDTQNFALDIQSKYVGASALFAVQDAEYMDLSCVYVIPGHCGGAVIWALNGTQAFFAYDADGKVEKPIRIALHKELLKACGDKLEGLSNRLQSDASMEYLRVVSRDENGNEEWTDFNPSPAKEAKSFPGYKKFIEKYQNSRPGIGAQSINGLDYTLMRKVFRKADNFRPILHQCVSEDMKGPIYNTFALVPEILIVTMPMNTNYENGDAHDNYYGKLSDLAMNLVAAPHSNGIGAAAMWAKKSGKKSFVHEALEGFKEDFEKKNPGTTVDVAFGAPEPSAEAVQ